MICVTGKKIPELLEEIYQKYGHREMSEYDTKFSQDKKQELQQILFTEKKLPDFELEIEKVSYLDGCKVYFKNGGWIIARFSGTEPLIRIFCEMETKAQAIEVSERLKQFLGLK